MRKIAILLGLVLIASPVQAAVTMNTIPTSLVTSSTTAAVSSGKAVFEFALTADAAETLTSVAVTVNSTTAVSADFSSVSVYRDDGDGVYDSGDLSAGSNTTVNVGTSTTVNTAANNTLTGAKFFVVLTTSATWSGTDSVTVTLPADGIITSANSPTISAVTTAAITVADITAPPDEGEDDDFGKTCNSGIINGKLYKVGSETTVYLAAACRLKPFRGAAVFHARGHKFQNIITLSSAPAETISADPALPAGGTLVKGSDATVWFVTNKGKRKGFVSANAFARLGFDFRSVKQISDSDLSTMNEDAVVTENSEHPEGSIIKCGNSSTVFEVKNRSRFPFTNPNAFLDRGHSWDVIANVDCGRFAYLQGSNVE